MARLRAMTALWLLMPETPLLFQGQEFAASTPFCYFLDNPPDRAAAVDDFMRPDRIVLGVDDDEAGLRLDVLTARLTGFSRSHVAASLRDGAATVNGAAGKPSVDMFLDDRALRLGNGMGGVGWWTIQEMYGQLNK